MVLAGNIYFDLAQTQQLFQTIVQLTHAHPTMSCIHLVMVMKQHYHQLKYTCYIHRKEVVNPHPTANGADAIIASTVVLV